MALTLAESAKLSQDTLAKGVLETFVQTSPILDRIPFMEIAGKRVMQWNGIPILEAGQTPAGKEILDTTETQGTATNTASIYAVKFGQSEGDQGVTGLTNGGVMVEDLGQLQEKPAYRTRIEFYCGLGVFSGKAAARLKGVLNG